MEAKGLEILKLNAVAEIVNEGFKIISKNDFDFEKCCDDVCYSINIVDSDVLAPGKDDPSETDKKEREIKILKSYASNKKYRWMSDDEGWSAHEFFHAFCYSQIDWTRKQRDMFDFFNSNDSEKYPINFIEFIAFSGQFAVMMRRGNQDKIEKIIEEKCKDRENEEVVRRAFGQYIKIAKLIVE